MPTHSSQAPQTMHHKHRLLLFLLAVVIIVIALFLAKKEINETPVNTNTEVNTNEEEQNEAGKQQVLSEYGFWIPRMNTEGYETSYTAGGGYPDNITGIKFGGGNTILIMAAADKGMIQESYGTTAESFFTVDGAEGSRITGTSAKDGSVMEYILLTHGDDLYLVRGDAAFLDEVQTQMIFN